MEAINIPLPIKDVIDIIVENTRRRGSPVPIPDEAKYRWTEGLEIPRGGDRILYTGLLYQLTPYIDTLVKRLSEFEEGSGLLIKLGRVFTKVIDVSRIVARVSKNDLDRIYKIIRNIALILKRAGIEYGYLYEDEPYSGVLLYDLGLDELFKKHAENVYKIFNKYGVKEVITIDPHTTYVLREIYPEYIEGYNIKVVNYLEAVSSVDLKPNNIEDAITMHDPCFYARYLNILDEPRQLLKKGGVEINEARRSGKLTYCCGGPIEAISPKLSSEVARVRVRELSEKSNKIVVLCPICYSNLSRVADEDISIIDISEYLCKIYC